MKSKNKSYKNIIALDFEMYNAKFYWSICWAGVSYLNDQLLSTRDVDTIINPGIKTRFIGPDIKFPFGNSILKTKQLFPAFYEAELKNFDGCLIIGHAIENDVRMIVEACNKFNLAIPDFDFIDSNACYNMVFNKTCDHSLNDLANEFNVVLDAHNPLSDAKTSAEVIRKITSDYGGLEKFLAIKEISVGSLYRGIIKRSVYPALSEKTKKRIDNFNCIYSAVKDFYNQDNIAEVVAANEKTKSKSYFFSSAVSTEFNLLDVVTLLLKRGDSITSCSKVADKVVVLAEPKEQDTNHLTIRALAAILGLDSKKYRLKREYKAKDKLETAKIKEDNKVE